MAEILDVGSFECPVSVVSRHPEMDALASEVMTAMDVQKVCGALPYGADTNRWPVRWYDAVRLAQMEKRRIEIACDKAGK